MIPRSKCQVRRELIEVRNVPAAMVSPLLRSNILPMSLFDENRSSGMPFNPTLFPSLRNDISTSAETFFVKTLVI